MEDKRTIFFEALKARAKESREKATEVKPIPLFKNPLIERMKAAREKAIADGSVTPSTNKMADIFKRIMEVQMNKIKHE